MSRSVAIALFAVGVLASACAFVEPETGERVAACVDADSDPTRAVSFTGQIRPMISGKVDGVTGCNACHFPNEGTRAGLDQSGLDLSTLGAMRKGGVNTGAGVIVAGSPCKSGVILKLRGQFVGARMPKGGPFWSLEQIQLVADWIAEGAKGQDTE